MVTALEDVLKNELGMNTKIEVVDVATEGERMESLSAFHIVTSFRSPPTFGPNGWANFMQTGATTFGCSTPMPTPRSRRSVAPDEERVDAAHDVQRVMYDTVLCVKLVNVFNLGGLRENIQGFVPWYEIASGASGGRSSGCRVSVIGRRLSGAGSRCVDPAERDMKRL